MDTLETIKNALLISLVLMLIFVLYKRLLRVVSKENIQSKYPNVGNQIEWKDKVATVHVELKMDLYLIIDVFSNDGNKVMTVTEGEYNAGNHSFSFDTTGWNSGRYFYKVTSSHQESSQYFEI